MTGYKYARKLMTCLFLDLKVR